MIEFLNEIFMPVNLPATLLLGIVLLYWLLVIVGVFGLDMLDFDTNLDAAGDIKAGAGEGLFGWVYAFFQLGEIPLTVAGSFFALCFWIVTIGTNHYFNPEFSWLMTLTFMVPLIGLSLIATRFILMPLTPLFRRENSEFDRRQALIGRQAIVNTNELNDKFGEIRIELKGPPLVLNARNEKGQRLTKGEFVTIVGYDAERDICIVELTKPEKT